MSTIDSYRHQTLGVIVCPSRFPIVYANETTRYVAIHRLEENIEGEAAIGGRRGDILVGGGHGESGALRISIPEAFLFYTTENWDAYNSLDEIHHAFWTMTQAFVFGDGYEKLGWAPPQSLESWLTMHILSFLLKTFPEEYQQFVGESPLEQDGSICRPIDSARVSE